MINSQIDIENILQKMGIDFNEIIADSDYLRKELFDMNYLLKTKNTDLNFERILYVNILLKESSFFKQIKPPIRLKVRIIIGIAHSMGYRI